VNLFYASFIPGLQNIVSQVIKERLSDVKVLKLLDGAVLFETDTSYDKLNFLCFNNIFAVISIKEEVQAKTQRRKEYEEAILESNIRCFLNGCRKTEIIANNNKNFKTFRIVIFNENKPVAINERLRSEAEQYIERFSGLKVNRTLADTEFWFLYRNEKAGNEKNFSIFMKRLTLRPSWEKTLHKGELPPPLAWTLCRLASLSHSDTVLDPFCGYGSIPEAAMKHFHITNFAACDNNREAVMYTAVRFKKRKPGEFIIHQTDIFKLPSFIAEKSIDAIITDPPWGNFKEIKDNNFYKKMFDIFSKLLKDNGRVVVLFANDEQAKTEFFKAATLFFELKEFLPILLSGKKAIVFVFERC